MALPSSQSQADGFTESSSHQSQSRRLIPNFKTTVTRWGDPEAPPRVQNRRHVSQARSRGALSLLTAYFPPVRKPEPRASTSCCSAVRSRAVAGATRVNIFANWNGAVAGIQNLTANQNVSFLVTNTASTSTLSAQADIAFSPAYQAGTPYTSPVLNDSIFGVSPVRWISGTLSLKVSLYVDAMVEPS